MKKLMILAVLMTVSGAVVGMDKKPVIGIHSPFKGKDINQLPAQRFGKVMPGNYKRYSLHELYKTPCIDDTSVDYGYCNDLNDDYSSSTSQDTPKKQTPRKRIFTRRLSLPDLGAIQNRNIVMQFRRVEQAKKNAKTIKPELKNNNK